MVQARRAARSVGSNKRDRGLELQLTTPGEGVKRRKLEDGTKLQQESEEPGVSRRRSSRQAVSKQTKASDLTATARRTRIQPAQAASLSIDPRKTERQREANAQAGEHSGLLPDDSPLPSSETAARPSKAADWSVGADAAPASATRTMPGRKRLRKASTPVGTQHTPAPAVVKVNSNVRRGAKQRGAKQRAAAKHPPAASEQEQSPAASISEQSPAASDQEQSLDAPLSEQDPAAADREESPAASDQEQSRVPLDPVQSPEAPAAEAADSPKSHSVGRRRPTHGTPHATFKGVKTSTDGITHIALHPDIKQVWTAFVILPSKQRHKSERMLFLGKNYWTAEAAARAVDRANIALHGRENLSTNFPLDCYGAEEVQRYGDELKVYLMKLAGSRNNNPRNAPGVPFIKRLPHFVPTNKLGRAFHQRNNPDWQPKKAKGKPSLDPAFAIQLWERLTGVSTSDAEDKGLQEPDVPWHRKVCGHCRLCSKAIKRKNQGILDNKKCIWCAAVPKLKAARQHLFKLARENIQQRFTLADLDSFLLSLPSCVEGNDPEVDSVDPAADPSDPAVQQKGLQQARSLMDGSAAVDNGDDDGERHMADLSYVPSERRGGVREKGSNKALRAMLRGKQKVSSTGSLQDLAEEEQAPVSLRRGRSQGLLSGTEAQRIVTWTNPQVAASQAREDALHEVQEQGRLLAADAAPHRGSYQPLLASAPPGLDEREHLKWPDHHAVDLRHIDRCAKEGKLVEVRNHDCWGAPALGMLGPPATALQGSFRHQPEQQHASNRACSWCKAEDHVIKECPLNAYLDEHMEGSSEQEAGLAQHAAARFDQLSMASQKAAPAEWLSQVSQPVKDVMSAMQQMAAAGVQSNEQKDSSHSGVTQSMSPDALLACGLLVEELMKSQGQT